jgi:hypothetical protein
VAVELVAIAVVRKRFMRVPPTNSLVQVTFAGIVLAIVGFAVGHE